jgi:hypothetical protein
MHGYVFISCSLHSSVPLYLCFCVLGFELTVKDLFIVFHLVSIHKVFQWDDTSSRDVGLVYNALISSDIYQTKQNQETSWELICEGKCLGDTIIETKSIPYSYSS